MNTPGKERGRYTFSHSNRQARDKKLIFPYRKSFAFHAREFIAAFKKNGYELLRAGEHLPLWTKGKWLQVKKNGAADVLLPTRSLAEC